jgi:hypothetical protein
MQDHARATFGRQEGPQIAERAAEVAARLGHGSSQNKKKEEKKKKKKGNGLGRKLEGVLC